MRVATLTPIATALISATWFYSIDRAHASEWGCEVLLCASSSNPSWHGVAACHAPMNRLISAMRSPGFSWPTCPEAGTGRPGHEPYDECPDGWSVGYGNQERGGGRPDVCVDVRNSCPPGLRQREDCPQAATMPRPHREDPYYFDIGHDDGQVTRHWFSLKR